SRGARPFPNGAPPGCAARHALNRARLARCIAALALAAALTSATVLTAAADPVLPPRYAEAVQRAYDLIQNASPQDASPAPAAVAHRPFHAMGPGPDHRTAEAAVRQPSRTPGAALVVLRSGYGGGRGPRVPCGPGFARPLRTGA